MNYPGLVHVLPLMRGRVCTCVARKIKQIPQPVKVQIWNGATGKCERTLGDTSPHNGFRLLVQFGASLCDRFRQQMIEYNLFHDWS